MTPAVDTEIVGRETELARVGAFVEATDHRISRVMVLEGEPGIGKSTVWLDGVQHARELGLRILLSRPAEAEGDLAYVGLGDLLDDVIDEVLPELSAPRREALETVLLRKRPAGRAIDVRAVGVATRDAFRLLAERGPVLITIDDAQWFDDSSSAVVNFALRRLPSRNVGALLTRRVGTTSALETAVGAERLTVGPLSAGAIHKLIQAHFGRSVARPAVLRIHEASGGNPFYALELARIRDPAIGLADPLAVPKSLDGLLAARLKNLPPATRQELVLVAAHGRPPIDIVNDQPLQAAFVAGVVEKVDGSIRFTHPLLASAVLRGSVPEMARKAHKALAEKLDDPIARARHLALAVDGPDEKTAEALEDAAVSAGLLGANMVSGELAELAVRLTPQANAVAKRRRLLYLADRLGNLGDGRRAIAVAEQALAGEMPQQARAEVTAQVGSLEDTFGDVRRAVERYRDALAEARGNDALEAEIYQKLAGLVMILESEHPGLEYARLAVEAASRAGDPSIQAKALASFGWLHFRSGLGVPRREMEDALTLERELPNWPQPDSATWTLVYQLMWSGELDRARHILDEMRAPLIAREDPDLHMMHWDYAIIEWRAGNWDKAAGHAAECLAIVEEYGIGGQTFEMPAAVIDAHLGRIEEARERSRRVLATAEEVGILIDQSAHRWVLGFIELSLGKPDRALAYIRRGWELRDAVRLMEPGQRLELADTLEALIAVGELDEANRKLGPWEERAQALDRSWALAITARCRGLLLAARGDMAGAMKHFDLALREHARTQDPFQHARTMLALGVTQRRVKQRSAARANLQAAADIFDRLPAPLWADKARAEIARIGGRKPAVPDRLTEAERRVAELVAAGRTNQEVATSLYLGERTVSSHLTHIYAKLGIRSRTELARRLR